MRKYLDLCERVASHGFRSQKKSPSFSKYWFACFTLSSGKRTQRSTKLTDRKAALKLAQEWEDAATKRVTEAQARRVLSDIYKDIHGDALSSPAVSKYVEQWLERKKVECRLVTYRTYKSTMYPFSGQRRSSGWLPGR